MATLTNRPRVREADTFRVGKASMSQKMGAWASVSLYRAPIETAGYRIVVMQSKLPDAAYEEDDDESDAAAIRAAMADPFRISLDEVLRLVGPRG